MLRVVMFRNTSQIPVTKNVYNKILALLLNFNMSTLLLKKNAIKHELIFLDVNLIKLYEADILFLVPRS